MLLHLFFLIIWTKAVYTILRINFDHISYKHIQNSPAAGNYGILTIANSFHGRHKVVIANNGQSNKDVERNQKVDDDTSVLTLLLSKYVRGKVINSWWRTVDARNFPLGVFTINLNISAVGNICQFNNKKRVTLQILSATN